MPQTLYPQAGQLLLGAAENTARNADREQREREMQTSLLRGTAQDIGNIVTSKYQQDEATKRQGMQGAQGLQQLFAQAQLNAQAEQEKYMRETIEVPPEVAQGMATDMPGAEKLAGQRASIKDIVAGYGLALKSKYVNKPIPMQIMENGKPVQGVLLLKEDESGNTVPTFNRVGEAVPKGSGSGKDANAKLLDVEKAIQVGQSKLLTEIKRGGLPDEAFGGEPGNVRKLAQWVSAGNFGNLDPEQKARVNILKGLVTTMTEQNKEANTLRKGLGREETDYTGFGGEIGGNDGAIVSYLQKVGAKDTPANREWAKKKLNG